MANIGPEKLLILFVVALLVLGPQRLPEAARRAGQWIGEIRRISDGLRAEVRDVFPEPREWFDAGTPASTVAEEPPSGNSERS